MLYSTLRHGRPGRLDDLGRPVFYVACTPGEREEEDLMLRRKRVVQGRPRRPLAQKVNSP
jgi:hypothetical protein